MFVGTNLIGLIVRAWARSSQKVYEENEIFQKYIKRNKRASFLLTILYCLITLLYFSMLYYYWNIGVVIAAIMLMFGRLPDLLFEIKTGMKINNKTMPRTPIYIIGMIIMWIALPLLWYSLCYW